MAPKVTYWCQTSICAHIRWCQNPSIDSTAVQMNKDIKQKVFKNNLIVI